MECRRRRRRRRGRDIVINPPLGRAQDTSVHRIITCIQYVRTRIHVGTRAPDRSGRDAPIHFPNTGRRDKGRVGGGEVSRAEEISIAGDGNKYLKLRDHVGNDEDENFRLRMTPRHRESAARNSTAESPFRFLDVHFSPALPIRGVIQHSPGGERTRKFP